MYLLMFFTSIIFSFEINLVELSLLGSPSIHTREMKSCVTYKKNRVLGACLIFLPTCLVHLYLFLFCVINGFKNALQTF